MTGGRLPQICRCRQVALRRGRDSRDAAVTAVTQSRHPRRAHRRRSSGGSGGGVLRSAVAMSW